MNETGGGSMDDVLASIRRIVRAEKEEAVATASDDEHSQPGGRAHEEPLVLTPEMRLDSGEGGGGATTGRATETSRASTEPVSAISDPEALRAVLRDLLREELYGGAGDVVRGIIRDELTSGQVGDNISQNVLRMIRAEVARALQAQR
jgi:hypothetical protein